MRMKNLVFVLVMFIVGCVSGTKKSIPARGAGPSSEKTNNVQSVPGSGAKSEKAFLTAASPEALATGSGSIIHEIESNMVASFDRSVLAKPATHSDARFLFDSGDGVYLFQIFGPKGEVRLKFACRSNLYHESPSGKYVLIQDQYGAYVFETHSGISVPLTLSKEWRPMGWWASETGEDLLQLNIANERIGASRISGALLWSLPCRNCSVGLTSPRGKLKLVYEDKTLIVDFTGKILKTWKGSEFRKVHGDVIARALTDDGHVIYSRQDKSHLAVSLGGYEEELAPISFLPSETTSRKDENGTILVIFSDSDSKAVAEQVLSGGRN